MELESKHIFKLNTPRVKSFSGIDKMANIVVTLFNGDVYLVNKDNFEIVKSVKVSNDPVRTSVIVEKNEWIIVGTDEGEMVILDSCNLSIINRIKAHDDFIRKIIVDEGNERIISISDDNSAKLWDYKDNIRLIKKYKFNHYGMDVSFCPEDRTLFIVGLLNSKLYLYSIDSEKPLKTFKGHEKGVNCICFITNDYFASGSDDNTIIIWDYKRGVMVTQLQGHCGMINSIYKLSNGFCSCSGDNSIRIWNDEFKTVGIRNTNGRAWAALEMCGKLFVGSDNELCVYLQKRQANYICMSNERIFYNLGSVLKFIKVEDIKNKMTSISDDIGIIKDIGEINDDFYEIGCNDNGKLIFVNFNEYFQIYSTLGLRKKYKNEGRCLGFITNDKFLSKTNENIILYSKFEQFGSINIDKAFNVLYFNQDIIICGNNKNTIILSVKDLENSESKIIHEFRIGSEKAFCFNNYIVLVNDTIHFYNTEKILIGTLNFSLTSFVINNEILCFSTHDKTYYLFIVNDKLYTYEITFLQKLIGLKNNTLYFFDNTLKAYLIDNKFINLQCQIIKNPDANISVDDENMDRIIGFYESLGMHEKALSLCYKENQKFEILLKLRHFDEAFKVCDSSVKFKKLGKIYLDNNQLEQAAKCFYHAQDFNSLFLIDLFAGKKYLKIIGEKAKESGEKNLAFFAFFKSKNYTECAKLLKGTPYYNVFKKHYILD